MPDPLVSIIIPVFNTEQYVGRCIQSVQRQLFSDWELLLVNDGSTDKSLEICETKAEEDIRIHVLSQSNAGASSARNKGISSAKGEWIMFVDSDDWIDPEMLMSMLKVTENRDDLDLIQTKVPMEWKQRGKEGIVYRDEAVRTLLEGSWWGPVCKLIRRKSINSVRFPQKTISEDYLFNYQVFKGIDKLYYLDRCFYHREIRPESLSRQKLNDRKFDEYFNVKSVSERVSKDYPNYKQLADSHLARTCLKLLLLIYQDHSERKYSDQVEVLLKEIKTNYFPFLMNSNIPFRERLILSCCFSPISSMMIEKLYHKCR